VEAKVLKERMEEEGLCSFAAQLPSFRFYPASCLDACLASMKATLDKTADHPPLIHPFGEPECQTVSAHNHGFRIELPARYPYCQPQDSITSSTKFFATPSK